MNTEERKQIEVVAAVICDGNRIFATQRGYGEWKDWWEFPGGKMEPGETPEAALQREIREELATEISVESLLTLLEHEAAKWLTRDELSSVKWLPADEEVVVMIKIQS